jgi:Fungal Zn(2)-Cys(6) binuclear cluster domain
MSISYGSPLVGSVDQNLPKAPQACMSCRKQKRKCNKGLPACSLCERMGRFCDYSASSPAPTSDDFNALRQKLLELERRLNGSNGSSLIENPSYLPTPSASTVSGTADSVGATPATPATVYIHQDPAYQNIQNRFPGIAFLDSEAFKYGQVVVPKPAVEIPLVSHITLYGAALFHFS